MALRRATIDHGVRELVKTLSGFHEGDQNLDISVQYSLSNLNYHRFLDADSHKIKRSLNGLTDKFRVHSQLEKADCLQRLLGEYLSTIDDDSPTETRIYYAKLSVLLLLAEKPTEHQFHVENVLAAEEVEEEVINWKALLLDGEDIVRVFPESPEISDDDEDNEEDAAAAVVVVEDSDTDAGFHEMESTLPSTGRQSAGGFSRLLLGNYGAKWLEENVEEAYWRKPCNYISSNSRSTNLSQIWSDHVLNTKQLCAPSGARVMELQIIRDVLWMLSGVRNLHVFIFDKENGYEVNQSVSVSHLTPNTTHSFLSKLCLYGNIVSKVHSFSEEMIQLGTCDRSFCRTYLNFATALRSRMVDMKNDLYQLEKECISEDLTLTILCDRLRVWFNELSLVDQIFTAAIEPHRHSENNTIKSSTLLNYLHDMLLALDAYGTVRSEGSTFLLPLWLKTCQPYFEIIDHLLTLGRLNDPTKEFFIRRDSALKPIDENFWSEAYSIESEADLPMPQFLLPVLNRIVISAKSMEILHILGRLSDVYEEDYQLLYTAIASNFYASSKQSDDLTSSTKNPTLSFIQSGDHQDDILRLNFDKLVLDHIPQEKEESFTLRTQSLADIPLIHQAGNCLKEHIVARSRCVNNCLMRIMVKNFDIHKHFTNVRKLFLMEAGDVMYDFYTDIFEKLRHHEEWSDVSYLTFLLHESLSQRQQEHIEVFVQVDQSVDARRQPITALNSLSLDYHVSWPAEVVLSKRCQKVYNQIFTFILQIKRSKYCLDCLHYTQFCGKQATIVKESDNEENKDTSETVLFHRVQLLRTKLMHFVNSLHNYIMVGVLSVNGLKFAEDSKKAGDLAELLDLHTAFLTQLHSQSLLSKSVILLKEAVMKALNLIIVFQCRVENSGRSRINCEQLKDLEQEFNRCIQFVSSFLNNLTKHQVLPHLENFAASISQCQG